jgi:hypothetical protein
MQPRPVIRAFVVAVVAGALSLGITSPAYGASAAKAPSAPKWAKTVCTSIGTWLDTIDRAATKTASGAATTPKAAKKALTKLLDQAVNASDSLVGKLGKAGAPAVADGKNLASILRGQYRQLSKSLKGALKTLKRAEVGDAVAFGGAARAVEDTFESALEQSQAAFNAAGLLDEPSLVDAFNAEPACADVTAV